MRLNGYGDFNCSYSYLASQRIDALRADQGRADQGRADQGRADQGRAGWRRELAEVAGLALPGEHAPTDVPALISSTYAATSAYAESITDGIADPHGHRCRSARSWNPPPL